MNDIERDYPDLLNEDSRYRSDVQSLRTAISENRATQCVIEELPGFQGRMFEAARSRTVAKSFVAIRRRFLLEILADGIAVACIFVAIRMWMGSGIADDGFGPIASRVASFLGESDAKKYLFAGFVSTALIWIGLRSRSRRLAKTLFGK
jgi:hypothetical protein